MYDIRILLEKRYSFILLFCKLYSGHLIHASTLFLPLRKRNLKLLTAVLFVACCLYTNSLYQTYGLRAVRLLHVPFKYQTLHIFFQLLRNRLNLVNSSNPKYRDWARKRGKKIFEPARRVKFANCNIFKKYEILPFSY